MTLKERFLSGKTVGNNFHNIATRDLSSSPKADLKKSKLIFLEDRR